MASGMGTCISGAPSANCPKWKAARQLQRNQLSTIPAVSSWRITQEWDFDKNRIMEDSREHDKAPGVTTMLGDWQVKGYVLLPQAFVEIEIAR